MKRWTLAALGLLLALELVAFTSDQQSVRYDADTGTVCFHDHRTTPPPSCVAIGRIDSAFQTLTLVSAKLRIGATQSDVGQVAQISAAHPGVSDTISADRFRVDVGGYPVASEYRGANSTVSAIVGAIATPSGTTTSPMSDVGVSGYALTSSSSRPAMGLFGEGGIAVSGASAWGLNTQPINCPGHDATLCGPGKGLDFGLIYGAESNTTVYSKSGGGNPTGSADGFVATFSGDAQSDANAAFHATRAGSAKWRHGLVVGDAAADSAIAIGSAATTAGSAGTPLEFNWRDGTNTRQVTAVSVAGDGTFQVGNDLKLSNTNHTNTSFGLYNNTSGFTWYIISDASGNFQIYKGTTKLNISSAGNFTLNGDASIKGTLNVSGSFAAALSTPASSSATCTAGQTARDANYIYTCVATNTWRRTSVGSTW